MSDKHGKLRPAVVLVSDRTLSARYRILFEGIFGTMQTTHVPELAMRHFVAPPARTDSAGRAEQAILGLRRLESTLLASGLSADEVVCATPESLGGLLGPWTRLVCFSSSDPLGNGMSNTTTRSFWSGRLYTAHWTERLLRQISAAKREHGFHVLAGGAGAWQLLAEPARAAELGIDTVFEGYCENLAGPLVKDILAGRPVPAMVSEGGTCVAAVRPLRAPSVLGVVELSRGCGKGCRFCLMAGKKMEHLDEDLILADVQTNAAGGVGAIVSSSEDFFRYGATGANVNFDRLAALLERMRQVRGLRFMQIDHGNISSVLQFTPEQLRTLRGLLDWPARSEYLWVNMGVESASGRLVQANCPGKAAPFGFDDWEQMVYDAVERLSGAGFYPVLSLVLGLPGETPDDVARTRRMVERLSDGRAVIFPVFHEPVRNVGQPTSDQSFGVGNMSAEHLALYRACYEINFRHVPRLYWDNQRAGGVGLAKRFAIQLLGHTEVRSWRGHFRRVGRMISDRLPPS